MASLLILRLNFACKPYWWRSRAEPCHWSEGRHNNVGVSLQERRGTTQVMLGVLLRARWDATLVYIFNKMVAYFCLHIGGSKGGTYCHGHEKVRMVRAR